jgi:poly(hydroxyalkanoate) depolymerase family esterase
LKIDDDLPIRLLSATPLTDASFSVRPFDVTAITDTIQGALASAGLDTQSGPMKGVTDTIRQALSAAGLSQRAGPASRHDTIIDGVACKVLTPHERTDGTPTGPTAPASLPGEFVSRSFTNHAGTRAYKLYVPSSYSGKLGEAVPMVVMLHGCTQSPDDFAAGTRMNALAEQHGFLVVYPAQAANANGSKCWNWFRSEDQSRDRGEPSLIAGITREVASDYHIDERRIFVAGLSAGAAMAVILGTTYPELYAAVGAHSGLPYGAAHDIPSAFGAMKSGMARAGFPNPLAAPKSPRPRAEHGVPIIVFHGDRDQTVNARNAAAIVEQAIAVHPDGQGLRAHVHNGVTSAGRTYSHIVYVDASNERIVEYWVLHGAGHAWSGGSPAGSFTDVRGPDASAEMIRFFYSQQRAGTA